MNQLTERWMDGRAERCLEKASFRDARTHLRRMRNKRMTEKDEKRRKKTKSRKKERKKCHLHCHVTIGDFCLCKCRMNKHLLIQIFISLFAPFLLTSCLCSISRTPLACSLHFLNIPAFFAYYILDAL